MVPTFAPRSCPRDEHTYDPEDPPYWDGGQCFHVDCPHPKVTEDLVRGSDGRWQGERGLWRIQEAARPDSSSLFAHRECADAALGAGNWVRIDFRVNVDD
ncbi:hypothetical protein [Micromonospora sp. NPDC002575]|uniref:hypothetical protein n=1 Tax=Micromonospora sp. NPDC002575 TaxID=3364222 RepID=UPI0036A007D7